MHADWLLPETAWQDFYQFDLSYVVIYCQK